MYRVFNCLCVCVCYYQSYNLFCATVMANKVIIILIVWHSLHSSWRGEAIAPNLPTSQSSSFTATNRADKKRTSNNCHITNGHEQNSHMIEVHAFNLEVKLTVRPDSTFIDLNRKKITTQSKALRLNVTHYRFSHSRQLLHYDKSPTSLPKVLCYWDRITAVVLHCLNSWWFHKSTEE